MIQCGNAAVHVSQEVIVSDRVADSAQTSNLKQRAENILEANHATVEVIERAFRARFGLVPPFEHPAPDSLLSSFRREIGQRQEVLRFEMDVIGSKLLFAFDIDQLRDRVGNAPRSG